MPDHRFKILIVDDDRDNALSLGELFQFEGHEVTIASNGDDAISACRHSEFDVTFMDVVMPGKNGVETFIELKQFNPAAKVVMMTGYSVEQFLQQALESGAVGIMAKPFDPNAVLALIEDLGPAGFIVARGTGEADGKKLQSLLSQHGRTSQLVEDATMTTLPGFADPNDVLIIDSASTLMESIGIVVGRKRSGYSGTAVVVAQRSTAAKSLTNYLSDFCATGILMKPFDPEHVVERLDNITA
jgi:two-component system, NtrC family, response regulator HydG